MRGLSVRRRGRFGFAFCVLAVFAVALAVVAVPAQPAQGADWKDLVGSIDEIRNASMRAVEELLLDFDAFLADGSTTEECNEALAETHVEIAEVADDSVHDISEIMRENPDVRQVQTKGSKAVDAVAKAAAGAASGATLSFNEYIAGLPATTTSTSAPGATTSTTHPPTTSATHAPTTSSPASVPTTTTTAAIPTTSTLEAPTGTSTTAASTTSTTAAVATTTEVIAATTTSTLSTAGAASAAATTTTAPLAADDSGAGEEAAGDSVTGPSITPPEARDEVPTVLDISEPLAHSGVVASLTALLDPVLPTGVTEVLVSPLMMLELLWRALSSGGQLLMIPGALLALYTLGMLWERRRANRRTVADA